MVLLFVVVAAVAFFIAGAATVAVRCDFGIIIPVVVAVPVGVWSVVTIGVKNVVR